MDGEVTCTFPISTHSSFIHSLTLQPLSKYLVSTCPMPNTFLGAGNIAISTLIQVLPHGASVSWARRVGKLVCLLSVPPPMTHQTSLRSKKLYIYQAGQTCCLLWPWGESATEGRWSSRWCVLRHLQDGLGGKVRAQWPNS